jgi:2-keto-3-deoxy-L-rhamnonate aldolase RhmA
LTSRHRGTLRQLLAEHPVVGTFLKLPQPDVVAILALAGFDFLICDLEHSQLIERDCRDVLLAARAEGIPTVVRIASVERGLINRLLEAGAAGIQMPRTRTAADVAELRSLVSYPPAGTRSLSLAQPSARYGTTPMQEYLRDSNEEVLTVGQFETADLIAPLDDVVEGLDVAFIGTLDLSVDAGVAGQFDSPALRQKVAAVEEAAKRTATPMGSFAPDAAAARTALERGYRYIAVAADMTLLAGAAHDLVHAIRDGGE